MEKQERRWWLWVLGMALFVSWPYFFGTSFVLGVDYFTHLAQGFGIQQGIGEGHFIPAYHFYYGGGGTTLIRYQGMLVDQTIGWLCFALRHLGLTDTTAVVYAGRIVCILINVAVGLAFYYAMRKLVDLPLAVFVGTCAYLWGWSRLGVVMHVGALQRAGAHIFFPLCFALYLLWWQRPLTRREQLVLGLAGAGCLLSHVANFLLFTVLCLIHGCVEAASRLFEARPAWQTIKQRAFNMALPAALAILVCAWFLFPFVMERQFYGQSIALHETNGSPVSLTNFLPFSRSREFIDREPWFGNFSTDNNQGGSLLANSTGVNSAYLGGGVLLCALLSILLKRFAMQQGARARRLAVTAIIMVVLIFADGVRQAVFGKIAHQLYLPCRWLDPFYFLLCVMCVFGACCIWEMARHRWGEGKRPAQALVIVAFVIVCDFASLIYFSTAGTTYLPAQGRADALAVKKNWAVFDSYDFLRQLKQPGRVVDLPVYNYDCNRIYHGQQGVYSFYDSNWTELISFTQPVVQQEIEDALQTYLAYGNFHPLYSLRREHFEIDTDVFEENPKAPLMFTSKGGWQGRTTAAIRFALPGGSYAGCLLLSLQLTAGTDITIVGNGHTILSRTAEREAQPLLIVLPFESHNSNKQGVLRLEIRLYKPAAAENVVINQQLPRICYDNKTLAYRLALLDARYIVINLVSKPPLIPDLPTSTWIKKIYQSPTSVIYENVLSTPFLFPQSVYLIPGPQAWRTFNDKIAHHPTYQPHLAGFCYSGDPSRMNGVLRLSDNWEAEIAALFTAQQQPPLGQAAITRIGVESMALDVTMKRDGYLFASYAFHPNLRAVWEQGGNKRPLPILLAQAGMMAIPLPQGSGRLAIHYHHAWYDWLGKLVSVATLLWLLLRGRKWVQVSS